MSGVWSLRIPARLREPAFPADCPHRTHCHCPRKWASSAGYSEFPAYSRMHTAPLPTRGAAFYLRHFVTPQLALRGWVVSVPPSSPCRHGGRTISSPWPGVWRMASEDSVEDLLQWTLTLFAVEVHPVGDLNDLRKASWLPVGRLREQSQDVPEPCEVVRTRGEPHVSRQEW